MPTRENLLKRTGRRVAAVALAAAVVTSTGHARAQERKSAPLPVLSPAAAAAFWVAAQLVPSPLLVAGSAGLGAGMRWQLTPLVYSFGVEARPLRAFVIEPVARHSGAIELFVSPEWACCAAHERSSWLARAGARIYVPLLLSGESLSGSLGGSYYLADHEHGGSVELGLYTLSSIVGLTVTVSPTLEGREVTTALALHYY
ncbi:MAG TPA: hypothetical protein VF331_20170 [Polyangiales bacterium]